MGRALIPRSLTPWIVVTAAAVASLAGWTWLAGRALSHPQAHGVTSGAFVAAVAMWQAMIVAMMTPAVAPWIIAYTRLVDDPQAGALRSSVGLAAGYFAMWLVYSVAGAALQVTLVRAGEVGDGQPSTVLAGAVLIAAGVFQFTPLKAACLRHCRNPVSYLLARWRGGPPRAFTLGLRHGAYCVGCCWALMLTGLAVGLMNLAWMGVVTVVVAAEQVAPGGPRLGRVFGLGLGAWGLALWMA